MTTPKIAQRSWRMIFAAAALSGAAACVSAPSSEAVAATAAAPVSTPATTDVTDPGTLLKPYWDSLTDALPNMGKGPSLDTSRPLTRIAFGSCNHQGRPQDMWPVIGAMNPQLFMAIGDNVYGDFGWQGEADLGSFVNAYRQQAAHPEFAALRAKTPILATWDDHDFGPNDSGGGFGFKQRSEQIFEAFWDASDTAKSRPGIYDSVIAGPEGQRVQIILLDTRFFRSALKSQGFVEPRPPLGPYLPDDDPSKTLLGDAQWQWLEGELAKPADLRLIVSSIQVLAEAQNFEKWGNLPREREKLYGMLKARNGGAFAVLSGDRHSASFYRHTPAALGEEVVEMTSSSLNLAFVPERASDEEKDPHRIGPLYVQENFGTLDIDWEGKTLTMKLRDQSGAAFATQVMSF